MDRAEATGFGVAAVGHLALLGVLSLGFANAMRPPIVSPPMEVSFVEDVAVASAAPSTEAPAAKLAELKGPTEDSAPPPPLPEVAPLPQPQAVPPPPTPTPRPAERPKPRPPVAEPRPAPPRPAPPKTAKVAPKAKPAPPKPAPAKPAPVKATAAKVAAKPKEAPKSTGRLAGLLSGIGETETKSRATAPAGKTASAAVKSSLGAEVRRQLKPHWKAPTGADAEQLRTELSITLAPNGAVTNVEVLRTTGQTDSNRPQVKLHQEQAVKAARLASPFKLPPEYYDAWKLLSPIGFDKRLSQ